MEMATLYFENNLKENAKVLEYLKVRGLNEKSIKRHLLFSASTTAAAPFS